jgi:hypothetical protein
MIVIDDMRKLAWGNAWQCRAVLAGRMRPPWKGASTWRSLQRHCCPSQSSPGKPSSRPTDSLRIYNLQARMTQARRMHGVVGHGAVCRQTICTSSTDHRAAMQSTNVQAVLDAISPPQERSRDSAE